MRQGRHDIRPALLLLFHAGDAHQFEAIHRHGRLYLSAYCIRNGLPATTEACELAAGDALAVMWARRAPQPVSARSRALRMRNSVYFELRTVALVMFQTRLHEARVRFASGTIYTRQSLSSKERDSRQDGLCAGAEPMQQAFVFEPLPAWSGRPSSTSPELRPT